MPLKLVPPRKGKSPNFTIRGSYLGFAVDKSSGTHKRSVAHAVLVGIERAIERGEYPPRQARTGQERTFLIAAVAYMEAGRSRRHVAKLIKHFGSTPLADIDQSAVDAVAIETVSACDARHAQRRCLHPGVCHPSSRWRKNHVKRPKGAKGRVVTDWLRPEDAKAIIQAAEQFDPEFALLLCFLLYTGLRLGEALALRWADLNLETATAWVRRQKDGLPRMSGCAPIYAHAFRAREQSHSGACSVSIRAATLSTNSPAPSSPLSAYPAPFGAPSVGINRRIGCNG